MLSGNAKLRTQPLWLTAGNQSLQILNLYFLIFPLAGHCAEDYGGRWREVAGGVGWGR